MDAMRRVRLTAAAMVALAMLPGSPFCAVFGGAPAAWAQVVTGKRLILKDGSYQLVKKYQVVGDRVRYLSEERDDWEEVPNSLIDWPATNKWNQEHALDAQGQPIAPPPETAPVEPNPGETEAAKIDREAAAERTELREQTPTVATGLQLPNLDGIFALDNFQNIPELIQLSQSAGDVNRGGTHNVLRAAIASFRGAQEPVRINGQAAKIRLHVDDPVLYVSLSKLQNEQVDSESALVVNTQDNQNPVPDKNRREFAHQPLRHCAGGGGSGPARDRRGAPAAAQWTDRAVGGHCADDGAGSAGRLLDETHAEGAADHRRVRADGDPRAGRDQPRCVGFRRGSRRAGESASADADQALRGSEVRDQGSGYYRHSCMSDGRMLSPVRRV